MGKVVKIIFGLLAVVIVAVIGVGIISGSPGNFLSNFANNAKNSAANAALDISGLKSQASQALESNKDKIASATGLSADQVDTAIDALAIEEWEVTSLPDDVQSTGSFSGNYSGVNGTITTYDDPSYVTVEAGGQTVTLSVPESAQDYLPYLSYL